VDVFVSGLGQIDNVGDTVLRRGLLNALRGGFVLHVYTGGRPEEYVSGLGLSSADVRYETQGEWRRALTKALARGDAAYAFNAGELEVDKRYAGYYLRLTPLLALSRLRGGRVYHTGFGIREGNSTWNWALRSTLRLANIVSWRDPRSASLIGVGRIAPDWAFAEGASVSELSAQSSPQRDAISVALRYDRPDPTAEWISSVREAAGTVGKRILVVPQIQRDAPKAMALARALGGDAIQWEGSDHASNEQRIRAAYTVSSLVLSDRLHGLVMAATQGAVPLALANSATEKTVRTLIGAGFEEPGISWREAEDASVLAARFADAIVAQEIVVERLNRARSELSALTAEMVEYSRG
jgi:polysaccharide pyruvyl transferase WcaK-like protein